MRAAPRRPKEEYLLLVVAAAAAAAASVPAIEELPSRPAIWAATSVALALSLVTVFAFWFGSAVRKALWQADEREHATVRSVLAAIPDGLLVLDGDHIVAANGAFGELLEYDPAQLAGARAPFPFWPPEHRHELEAWHASLGPGTRESRRLMFARRSGERVPVLVAARELGGAAGRYVVSVRDVSESYRRERRLSELSSRDLQTALLDERGFEASLRAAARRARASGTAVSVAILELGSSSRSFTGHLGAPEALIAIERLQATLRAGDELARTRDDEIAWILPDASAAFAVEAVARARRALAEIGATVTAGVCDLAAAGDVPSLFALADRALMDARREGVGTTTSYAHAHALAAPPRAEAV